MSVLEQGKRGLGACSPRSGIAVLALFACALVALCVAASPALATGDTNNGLYWEREGDTLTIKYGEYTPGGENGPGAIGEFGLRDIKADAVKEATKIVVEKSVHDWKPKSLKCMFDSCSRAQTIEGLENFNTAECESFWRMFYGCSSVKALDLSGWDTSKCTNMGQMFGDGFNPVFSCTSLETINVSGWVTSACTNMGEMFSMCKSLKSIDVSGWDTSKCENMNYMFQDCYSLKSIDVSKWDTSACHSMSYMFSGCSALESINVSTWNTANVIHFSSMFNACRSLKTLDLSGWDTSSAGKSMYRMFRWCQNLSTLKLGNKFSFPKGSGETELRSDVSWKSSADGKVYAADKIPSKVAATYTAASTPAPAPAPAPKKEMFRLYNSNSGEHFYTSNKGERDNLKSLGWTDEGQGWNAPAKSNTPVFRLYNPNAGEHHYAMSRHERDVLVSLGWVDEGVGWYSDDAKGVTLYRLYNPNEFANNHHYTLSAKERDALVAMGWKDEGAAWYGMK